MAVLDKLVGKTVTAVHMSEDTLVFIAGGEQIAFGVDQECCSTSYFYDFHGLKALLGGHPISGVEALPVEDESNGAPRYPMNLVTGYEENCRTSVYGYRITIDDPSFGPTSAVFSFRNDSNGYYGGELRESRPLTAEQVAQVPQITADYCIEAPDESCLASQTVVEAKESQTPKVYWS